MPGFDGTGPMARGMGRGRGRGACGRGLAFGRGFGRGAGYCAFVPADLTVDEQKKILKAQLAEMDLEKKEIEAKLKELGKE